MPATPPDPPALQVSLCAFAIGELVRQHRASFPPLWTAESWAKLLIWLSLNCGCRGDEQGLRAFAAALGPVLSGRMRRLFFQRELEDLGLQVLADPAEREVLLLPLDGAAAGGAAGGAAAGVAGGLAGGNGAMDPALAERALERLALLPLVAPPSRWQSLEALIAVPWGAAAADSVSESR